MSDPLFLTRNELVKLGLSQADIDAFNRLRTREGRIDADIADHPPEGMSPEAATILAKLTKDAGHDGRLPALNLELTPVPLVADLEPAVVAITYHSYVDREQRVHHTEATLRGRNRIELWDISLEHAINIDITSAHGVMLLARGAVPANRHNGQGENRWDVVPALEGNEYFAEDGNLYVGFAIPTRGRRPIKPHESGPPSRIHRNGRYQVLGKPEFRFDSYYLTVSFPTSEQLAALAAVFGDGSRARLRTFHAVDPKLRLVHENLQFEPASLDFDGVFEIGPVERAGLQSPGWVWVLTGPQVVIGFQPDPDIYAAHPDIVITLPGDQLTSTGDAVPYNVTEKGLLERPELFGDDPGTNCEPFEQPNRVLSERRFYTTLRVTQPFVHGASESSASTTDAFARPVDFPRQPTTVNNPIEYEADDVSLYQARSVAFGHIIETAVRYRSNGYSLGDIAYSLTLAPRQKRRIVKMDYARRESASRVERTLSEDEVSDTVTRDRDYDNTVSASLDEWAQGRSKSSTTAGAAGVGFAGFGVVLGGGAVSSSSSSSSSQEGARRATARETQNLRDAIRRWGDSTRALNSTVVTESEQTEHIEGVSEVIQNINFTRSLSVVYYEILRHLRIDTEVAGVSECIFVPLPVREFDDERIKRHREVLRRYARGPWERMAFTYLDFLPGDLAASGLPAGQRANQKLSYLSGTVWIRIALAMPGEGELAEATKSAADPLSNDKVLALFQNAFSVFSPFMGTPLSQFLTAQYATSPEQRNRYFQTQIAPDMARRYLDELRLHDAKGTALPADFTMVGSYRYGAVVRADFTVALDETSGVTRKNLSTLEVRLSDKFRKVAGAEPEAKLPKDSQMNVTRATLRYWNDHYEDTCTSDAGERDLVTSETGHADPGGAVLSFKLTTLDALDVHEKITAAYGEFKARLMTRPFFYHKAIWWQMDRDELFTLLDGFAISPGDSRSIASVVERNPMGIVGNSIVFRTNSDTPLDPMFTSFRDLKNHYVAGLRPTDPMRISLPTQGVYARAHLDGCVAAEEHNGSFDWVFDNVEPELADLPDSIFASRRAEPGGLTPTAFPQPIINLQNAQAAPEVSGLAGALGAVQNPGAFRDMAGLAGTQANTLAGLNAAAGLASTFGTLSSQGALAQSAADSKAGSNLKSMMDALDKGVNKGLLTAEDAKGKTRDMADRLTNARDDSDRKHQQELEKEALRGAGGGEVTETTKDGTRSAKKYPPAAGDDPKPRKPSGPPAGYAKWLGARQLLLYNFDVGDRSPALQAEHLAALHAVSKQITGVDDIEVVEGRASKTQSRTGDPDQVNEELSLARMDRVWRELMTYAVDPQSNPTKQRYLGATDPIRAKHTAELSSVPTGTGEEDPVERSVLIRLTRPVPPEPETHTVPDCPEIRCVGHTVQSTIDSTTIVKQDTFKIISEGNVTNLKVGDVFAGGTVTNIGEVNVHINLPGKSVEVHGATEPGRNPAVAVEFKPTRSWLIDISNPRASGVSAAELFTQLSGILTAAKTTTAALPSGGLSIGVSGTTISASDINPPNAFATFISEIFDAVIAEHSTIGKTLRGLMAGTVEVDVLIHAKPVDAPATPNWDKRKFVLSGRGLYYAREFENPTATIEGVRRFDYETAQPWRLTDWGLLEELRGATLMFKRGPAAIPGDFTDVITFISDLTTIFTSTDDPVLGAAADGVSGIATTLDWAKRLLGGDRFVFKPEGETQVQTDQIDVGRTITAFELPKGALREAD